jgi:hypothetical protein
MVLGGPGNIPLPSPLYVTGTVTGLLILAVALLLERVRDASVAAFS